MISVLVGVPTLNGSDRLSRCLTSIAECTPFDRYQIKVMVCDDGSTPVNLEANKSVIYRQGKLLQDAGLEMLMHQERRGIAAGWNSLTRFQLADVVVLLNDDIEVISRWLDVLVHSVTKNPQLGMVSLNQYTGITKGQHRAAHPHLLPHVAEPILAYHEAKLMTGQRQLLASHGSIFAFRREVYDLVGGFDERYMVFYEELDFGVSLREKGYIHAVASYPIVYHTGGATLSDPKNVDAKAQLARSRDLFHTKWNASIETLRTRYNGAIPPLNEWNTSFEQLNDQDSTFVDPVVVEPVTIATITDPIANGVELATGSVEP